MKRGGELKRTPLKPGKGFKSRATPMSRGTSTLSSKSSLDRSKATLDRSSAPIKARSKTNANPRPKTGEAEMCRGQPCYLLVPGVLNHPIDTVVPCHSNQIAHGKGKGIKAHDKFTVPGCMYCHHAIDQSGQFSRVEKFAIWDAAYERWAQVRSSLLGEADADSPASASFTL